MYLKQYEIEGTKNLDTNLVFSNPNAMPNFQEKYVEFKKDLTEKQRVLNSYKLKLNFHSKLD